MKSKRLTDEQLDGLFSFYWSDYSNWFDVDREMAGKVLFVVGELRDLRAENAALQTRINELESAIESALNDISEAGAGTCDSIANGFISAAVEWLECALTGVKPTN